RRLLPGGPGGCAEPARPVAPVPHRPRVAHRGELRARADVPARCLERRPGDHGAPSGGAGPVLGAALLSMTRALLIANPAAARTDARAVTAIRDTLRGGGWTVEVRATAQAGDARRFAREATEQGFDALVCYGGDGTAMEIAAGAADGGIPLGLVPGVTSPLHRVTVDGVAHELPAAMVLVANCGELVPPFLRLRDNVAPDDGWLDVLVLRAEGALESLSAFYELLRRPRNGARRLWFGRGRTVRVEVLEGPPRPMQLDGEPAGDAPFEARLLPGALRVIVDPRTAPLGKGHA